MALLLAVLAWNRTPDPPKADPLTMAERAWLKAHPVIRLAPDPDFPPVEYFDKDGRYSGITSDYLALLEKKLGIRFEIVRLRNWDEIIGSAKRRQIDAFVASTTPQRSAYTLSTTPFLEYPAVIIAREKVKGPLTLESLGGMRVSAVSEYATHDFIAAHYPKLLLDPVPDIRTGLRKVSFGLSDAFVENLATASYYIEREGISNLRIAGDSGYVYRMGFCSRNDWPELNRILEKGVAGISAEEKRAIYNKWIPLEHRSLFSSRKFQIGLLVVCAAILAIVVGVIAVNRALARQVRLRTGELESELARRRRMEEELRRAREELEKRVEDRTVEVRNANELLEREITVRRRNESVIMARLRLLQFAGTHTQDELLEATLDEAEALTGSVIGFYVLVLDDQKTLSLQNWSTRTKRDYCKAEGKGLHYDIAQAGVWTDCIHQRRPVIHNDYGSLSHRKGLPSGHAPLARELVVPVFRGENIVAILAVGNKPTDYTPLDVEAVVLLADLAWEITEQKRMEKELLLSHFCIDGAAIGIYHTTPEGTILNANDFACRSLGYTPDEVRALKVKDIDPVITDEKIAEIKRLLESTGSVTHESVHRRKDGTTFPVEIVTNSLEFQGRVYGFSFVSDITERKRAEETLRESESRASRKLDNILDPEGDTAELDLADILDAPQIQALMNDMYRITGLKMSIIDLKGRVLVDMGWQGICARFHRAHPETLKNCIESDSDLTVGVPRGEFKTYRCKNNMWHLVTPIIVGERHRGNLFMGQFFFENEEIDYDLFRRQARTYCFPEKEYIAALESVPRHSEELVNQGKTVFLRLIDMFSKLSYANIKLAHSLAERDQLTATLRQANMVVENSPVVLFRCKPVPGWPVELVSRNVLQFGYTPEEFMSGERDYASIVYPPDLGWVTGETDEYAATDEGQLRQEYRILTKAGEIRWIIDETNYERNEAGEITNLEGVIIDVTQRKRAEEELQRQQSLLKELNDTLERRIEEEVKKNREKDILLIQQNRQAALGEMLDHIAHQWKQPINSISLIAQDMADSSSYGELTDGDVQTTIDKIMSLLEHMSQTVDVFRGFYRPDKETKLFSIRDAIDQALVFITPVFRYESIAIELDVDGDMTAFGYPKEYAQALLNILANARDVFRKRKTREPRVLLRGVGEGGRSVVTITDNAGGIPEAIIDRIFDVYFTTNEASGGTGIGLYMSRNIVEKNMGGNLSAENVEGGARFRIELPSA
ncbi:PocR ligand-binding domain-containing protein [Pelobacter propionicus]|uniref:PocR ligand-binding domain-containing protein n=1 Tax=Pelobacter propionicus TaxID=29543 RepID=UPI0018DD8209|nr:PocR ligand-binding domain-containing protein [Pelobacter propionicus]